MKALFGFCLSVCLFALNTAAPAAGLSGDLLELRDATLQMYQGLDDIETVSEEFATPHVPWMKPVASGKIKTLFMIALARKGVADTRRRDVVECAQRLDIDYTYIPLLKRMLTSSNLWAGTFGADLEDYILARACWEIGNDYELIVIDGLDAEGVQEEFFTALLKAAEEGRGVVFLDCKNLPDSIESLLVQNAINLPLNFAFIPALAGETVLTELSSFCRLARPGKGRLAVVARDREHSPSVSSEKKHETCPNIYGKTLPDWEYLWLPVLKTMVWAAGRNLPSFERIALEGAQLSLEVACADLQDELFLEVTLRDVYNQIDKVQIVSLKPESDKAFATLSFSDERGGKSLADCRLLNGRNEVLDFGSCLVNVPQAAKIRRIKLNQPSYHAEEQIEAKVFLAGITPGCILTVEAEDTWNRRLVRLTQELEPDQTEAAFAFEIEYPLTVLHRLFVEIQKEGKVLERQMQEFSMPYTLLPLDDFYAYVWDTQYQAYPCWKELGFDSLIASYDRDARTGVLPALNNLNIRPFANGSGAKGVRPAHKGQHSYDGPDTVREPCFSDPAYYAKRRAALLEQAAVFNYHGVHEHLITDGMHLGPNVCLSEHCLSRFQLYLKDEYESLAHLNAAWETNFAAWEDVKPLQRHEVSPEKNNLTSWLDHRMFMTTVFAGWVSQTKEILSETNPLVRAGLSGSLNPDLTSNWWELMKIIDFLANDGGIQNELIRSFQMSHARCAQCTGGYAPVWIDAERYVCSSVWDAIFNDRRAYFYWHGSLSGYGLLGDLRPSRSLAHLSRELQEVKKGIGKLLLNAERLEDGIGIHYSQASLFAATATIGADYWRHSLDSWRYLLSDLGLGARFISYEQLARDGLDLSRIQVFVMPFSLVLSDAEIINLKQFVEAGGMIIADWAPGVYTGHGKISQHSGLEELFGISRNGYELYPGVTELRAKAGSNLGLKDFAAQIQSGETGLTLKGAQAWAETDDQVPAVIVNQLGKGRAVLLNCLMSDYANVQLTGQGSEEETLYRGEPAVTEPLRALVADILHGVGVESKVKLTSPLTDSDLQVGTLTVRYASGNIRYIGVLQPVLSIEPEAAVNRPSDYMPVLLKSDAAGHIYNVRTGEYLGEGGSFETTFAPGTAGLFAILPYKVMALNLAENLTVRRGERACLPLEIITDGTHPGLHVAHVEISNPAQTILPCYSRNIKLEAGKGVVEIPIALNDAAGVWQMSVKDVASGISAQGTFAVK